MTDTNTALITYMKDCVDNGQIIVDGIDHPGMRADIIRQCAEDLDVGADFSPDEIAELWPRVVAS